MKILLTGATGQVGRVLAGALQPVGEVMTPGRADMDLANPDQLRRVIRTARPHLIVNCAAYTAVDQAEREPELAYRINAVAPAVIAEEAKSLNAALVHFSTDYVFDGRKAGPYLESDAPHPVNVYGASKLAGESAIAASGVNHLIVRCSWIYGMHGNNFLSAILRLANTKRPLRVVDDQYGAPTWSGSVAAAAALMIARAAAADASWWSQYGGIYHMCSRGRTSWHAFAQAILHHAGLATPVLPVSSAEYGAAAQRPANSAMSVDKLRSRFCDMPDWQQGLAQCFDSQANKDYN